jgi:hypothetical protein
LIRLGLAILPKLKIFRSIHSIIVCHKIMLPSFNEMENNDTVAKSFELAKSKPS